MDARTVDHDDLILRPARPPGIIRRQQVTRDEAGEQGKQGCGQSPSDAHDSAFASISLNVSPGTRGPSVIQFK